MNILIEMLPVLAIGFGLGFLHALDADHVMAVSTLSNQRTGVRRTIFFSANWAIGHGLTLLTVGLLLFGIGYAVPESLVWIAEKSVGLLLIFLGLLCFWQFRKDKLGITEHSHGDIVHRHIHAEDHLHSKDQPESGDKIKPVKEQHKPVFVGILHGLAGSAPALALVPAVAEGQLKLAIAYLLIFSLGVMLSMLFFGLGFAYFQQFLHQRFERLFDLNRRLIAFVAIALGAYWLVA